MNLCWRWTFDDLKSVHDEILLNLKRKVCKMSARWTFDELKINFLKGCDELLLNFLQVNRSKKQIINFWWSVCTMNFWWSKKCPRWTFAEVETKNVQDECKMNFWLSKKCPRWVYDEIKMESVQLKMNLELKKFNSCPNEMDNSSTVQLTHLFA